jgi:hypothetical protein
LVLCSLPRRAVKALHEQKFYKHRKRHSALTCDFARSADEIGRQRNACALGSFVRWDFGMGHI